MVKLQKRRLFLSLLVGGLAITIATTCLFASSLAAQNTPRSPSDVVREFYKAMRERRFKDAWSLTIYKPAVQDLSAEEMEDLRPDFEDRATKIPEQVEITAEQINGNVATVFVKVSVSESTPQITSEPVTLLLLPAGWVIGTEADQAEVKKAGRRYFLDALINEDEGNAEEVLKRLVVIEGIYSQQHGGAYIDFPGLIKAGAVSSDAIDPKLTGYTFHITLGRDSKSYVASAEPTRHGHTGKLSFWMDQTGLIKSADNGGKPLKP